MTGFGSPPGRHGRRWRAPLVVLAAGAALVACSADPTDFKVSAEDFIEGDTMAGQAGTEFTAARCDEPSGTDPETSFRCEAVAADGVRWEFEVTIVDDAEFEISGRATGQPASG